MTIYFQVKRNDSKWEIFVSAFTDEYKHLRLWREIGISYTDSSQSKKLQLGL